MNKDKYKSELDNIKPDEKLVRNTINLIREREEQKQRKNIFSFNKLAVGFCSVVILGSIGYTYFNYNTNSKVNNNSKEKNKYASSTIYKIEEDNSNMVSNIKTVISKNDGLKIDRDQNHVPSKRIGFDKIDEKSFTGMYLIRESDGKNWKYYKHTKEYNDFKKFRSLLDSVSSEQSIQLKKNDTYKHNDIVIYNTYGEAYTSKNTMRVKIGYQYMVYLPVMADDTIVVQLLSADKITVYEIKRDMSKEDEYAELRDFLTNTGTEIQEDVREGIDRNIKSFVNGKEDKSGDYADMLFGVDGQLVKIKYTFSKKLFIVTFKKDKYSVSNPKIQYNREYNLDFFKGKVEDAKLEYLGTNDYPYIIVLTTNKDVYYIDTREWAKTGKPEIKKVATNATKIEYLKDKNDRYKMYATINGKRTELNIGEFKEIIKTTIDKKTNDISVKYTSENGKLLITFNDTFKKEIDNPKIQLNKEIEFGFFKNKVKDLKIAYLGKDSYPHLVILTNSGEVYRIQTSKWVSTGDYELIRLTTDATEIEVGKDSNGNASIFATVNNKKIRVS